MSDKQKNCIMIRGDIGGLKAAEAVQPHLIILRRLLDEYCRCAYAPIVDEFAPIVRVDGDIAAWEFEGCEKLRWSRKGRYITVDIGVPRSRWENVPPIEIRKYLINNLKNALSLMVKRLKKEKVEVDDVRLFEDIAKVEKEFLSS